MLRNNFWLLYTVDATMADTKCGPLQVVNMLGIQASTIFFKEWS